MHAHATIVLFANRLVAELRAAVQIWAYYDKIVPGACMHAAPVAQRYLATFPAPVMSTRGAPCNAV